jgi:hypothetical protein
MVYYRVKPEYDNVPYNDKHDFLIANELWTEKELTRNRVLFGRKITFDCFERVEISRRKIYWFFGARFHSTMEV